MGGSEISHNMSIDEQIKQIQDLGYSVDYNLKGNYITCIYESEQFQYTQMHLKNFDKVLIDLENFKNFIDDHK